MGFDANGVMTRPTTDDDYVRRRAAEIIFPEVWGWLGKGAMGDDEHDVKRDLASIARMYDDGYELAKALDGKGWACDERLVEILGSGWVETAVEELTAQWVRCLNIRPQFSIGDTVKALRGEGVVVKIDERLAQYGIRYPGMSDKSWTVVDFERCSAPVECAA